MRRHYPMWVFWVIYGLLWLAVLAMPVVASDHFVQMLEARMGVSPGATRVLPECGCTVRYLGTAVHGTRYTVQLDRLD